MHFYWVMVYILDITYSFLTYVQKSFKDSNIRDLLVLLNSICCFFFNMVWLSFETMTAKTTAFCLIVLYELAKGERTGSLAGLKCCVYARTCHDLSSYPWYHVNKRAGSLKLDFIKLLSCQLKVNRERAFVMKSLQLCQDGLQCTVSIS